MLSQIQESSEAIISAGREFGIVAVLLLLVLGFFGWLLLQALHVWKSNEGSKTEAYVKAQAETASEMKDSYRAHTASTIKINEAVERMAESSINTNHAVEGISRSIEMQIMQTSKGQDLIANTHNKTDAIHRAICGLIDVGLEIASGDAKLIELLRKVHDDLQGTNK